MQVFITGGAGRLALLLRAAWADTAVLGFDPVWCCRRRVIGPDDVTWDILADTPPAMSKGAVILHLAGVLRGERAALAANSALALKVCEAAKAAGAAHVFLASSAAVYGAGLQDHVEVQAPAPFTDYGRAKLGMERTALCWAHQSGSDAPGVTCLRIGNVLGADALFGGADDLRPVVLDPVLGQTGGPQRSYIGPQAFAKVIAGLFALANARATLPSLLNIAAPGAVFMADLLDAAVKPYHFGALNPHVIPKVSLSTKRLAALMPMRPAEVAEMMADWHGLKALAN